MESASPYYGAILNIYPKHTARIIVVVICVFINLLYLYLISEKQGTVLGTKYRKTLFNQI